MVFNDFLHVLARPENPQLMRFNALQMLQIIGTGDSNVVRDQDVVDKWLFAREAQAMGITVNDKTLNDFLNWLTAQSLGREKIVDVLKNIRQGVSETLFLSILREELLALRYRELFHQLQQADVWNGATATPDERWTTFKQINEQATIEIALFKIRDFLKQVPAPSEEALQKYFDDHKKAYASPYSPEPGFHVPREVNLQYLEADEEKFRAQVTEAEITQRLEKDPHTSDLARFEEQEKTDREMEEAAAKATAEKKPEKKPESGKTPDAEKKPDAGKKPESGKAPDVEKKPEAEKKPETPKTVPAESKPAPGTKPAADAKPAVDTKANPGDSKGLEPAKTPPAAKSSSSSLNVQRSPFRLVSLADDKPGEKAAQTKDEKKQPGSPSTVPPAAKPGEDKKPVDDKKPAEAKKPTDDKKPADNTKPADDKKSTAEKKPAAVKKPMDDEKPSRPPIETAKQRLRDEVRNEIAQEKLQAQLNKIQTLLTNYHQEWVVYDVNSKLNPDAKKPTPPDFGALATEYNMSAERTGLISQGDLAETDLGKSFSHQQNNIRVLQAIFLTSPTTLYKPDVSDYNRPNSEARTYFVFWKIDDQPDHIPNWEDAGIQKKVRESWELNEARKKAEDAAKQLKAEAEKKENVGKSLKELASPGKKKDFTVLTPPEFCFLTRMYGARDFKLGDVLGLEKIGVEFMQKVFGLAKNEVAVAANQPKTEIYLVRAVKFTPFEDLWSDFTEDADDWTIYSHGGIARIAGLSLVIGKDMGDVSQAWRKKVYADAGLKWEKPTDQRSAPGESPGPPPDEE